MLRWIFRFVLYVLGTLGLISLVIWVLGYGYLFRGIALSYLKGYNSANIYDGQDFETRKISNGSSTSMLPHCVNYNSIKLSADLQIMLDETGSTSFLVLKNDSIAIENYYLNHKDSTLSNSFSMAKTITTLLVQMAIEEGKIPSWETNAKTYLPWLEGQYASELTLRDLSAMTAGLNWSESYYNPFSITAEAYYGRELEKTMHKVQVVSKPGVNFKYQSGATQLLGICLREAVKMPIATYAAEKLWKPLGTEYAATWHTDKKEGLELTYCCFNAATRDFARMGAMVLHYGTYNNHHFVDSAFVATMMKERTDPVYGQAMWLGKTGQTDWAMFQGTLGQYIIVVPSKKLVIVRTGNHSKKGQRRIPDCGYMYADEIVTCTAFK